MSFDQKTANDVAMEIKKHIIDTFRPKLEPQGLKIKVTAGTYNVDRVGFSVEITDVAAKQEQNNRTAQKLGWPVIGTKLNFPNDGLFEIVDFNFNKHKTPIVIKKVGDDTNQLKATTPECAQKYKVS